MNGLGRLERPATALILGPSIRHQRPGIPVRRTEWGCVGSFVMVAQPDKVIATASSVARAFIGESPMAEWWIWHAFIVCLMSQFFIVMSSGFS